MAAEATYPPEVLSARLAGRSARIVPLIAGLVVAGYAVWRMTQQTTVPALAFLAIATLVMVGWDLIVAGQVRVYRAEPGRQQELDELRVVALVPVYNEDETALRQCLESLLRQSRPLGAVCVTDDGSTCGQYESTRAWFEKACRAADIDLHWTRQANGGKRRAQVAGAIQEPGADIFLTVDSDTVLDPTAVAEGVQPFVDDRIQSVAGIVLTANYQHNLLTRVQELWFTTLQLVSRGALSRMGAVMVNCGGCAFYRSEVLTENLDTYLTETCMGRPMHASDDSLLTLFALRRGRAVQQPSAFGFTLMPTTFSHHRRQQLRWMRGSTVRSFWRFAHLPTTRFAYWQHLAKWVHYGAVTAVAAVLLCTGVIFQPMMLIFAIAAAVGLYLAITAPYLTLRRSDQTRVQQLGVLATVPVVALWQLTVMRLLRWYAIVTFPRITTGWGTRTRVEVPAV